MLKNVLLLIPCYVLCSHCQLFWICHNLFIHIVPGSFSAHVGAITAKYTNQKNQITLLLILPLDWCIQDFFIWELLVFYCGMGFGSRCLVLFSYKNVTQTARKTAVSILWSVSPCLDFPIQPS